MRGEYARRRSLDAEATAILHPGAVGPTNSVSDSVVAEIQERLRQLASSEDVDGAALKRETRRLLTLMLAEAETSFERRETIKMLAEVEGYKKLTVSPDGGGPSDGDVKRLARLAGG